MNLFCKIYEYMQPLYRWKPMGITQKCIVLFHNTVAVKAPDLQALPTTPILCSLMQIALLL